MKAPTRLAVPLLILAPIAALMLAACGGNRPADQAAAPDAATPSSASTPAPQAAPPDGGVAQVAPPPAERPAPTPAAKPNPRPAASAVPRHEAPPPPKPEPIVKTLPAGTEVDVELVDAVSSKNSQVGDTVRVRVAKAVMVDGLTVVPTGVIIGGVVTEAVPLKKIGGAASLGLRFETLELPDGTRTAIAANVLEKGKSETGKDAGTIAGATAGGALLGRLLSKNDKTKGTLIGAAVGAAAGTGAAAATKGQEVELPAGTPLALRLDQAIAVTVRP